MLDRLNQLEINTIELEKFKKKYSLDDVSNDIQVQWILRYGLFESIQIVIDIACHLTTKYNLGNPKNYADCINLLKDEKYISREIADRLIGMVGLRNILVHQYISVDTNKIYNLLEHLDDFKKFAYEIKNFI
ncbi:MAG: DUF86 domain-containing protein [Ignavibacteriales bacterium]|nr:DUF86 domain-containing protein [Ignavibacteriales bacterium]